MTEVRPKRAWFQPPFFSYTVNNDSFYFFSLSYPNIVVPLVVCCVTVILSIYLKYCEHIYQLYTYISTNICCWNSNVDVVTGIMWQLEESDSERCCVDKSRPVFCIFSLRSVAADLTQTKQDKTLVLTCYLARLTSGNLFTREGSVSFHLHLSLRIF